MKLIDLAEYRELRFPGTRKPSMNSLRRWVASGELPGRKIGGRYYIDLEAESRRTGDAMADEILAKMAVGM